MSDKFVLKLVFPELQKQPYEQLLWPIAQGKAALQLSYDLLLQVIFDRWRNSDRKYYLWAQAVGGLIFLLLSLLIYYTRSYDLPIFLGLVLVWSLDVLQTQRQFHHGKAQTVVRLFFEAETLTISRRSASLKPVSSQVLKAQIAHVAIAHTPISGGAFQAVVGSVWRVQIVLKDHRQFTVFEAKKALEAMRKGKLIQGCCQVPLRFSNSQGFGPYAQAELSPDTLARCRQHRLATIRESQLPQPGHLVSNWTFQSSIQILQTGLGQAGFLLFLLLGTNLMGISGQIIHGLSLTSPASAWSVMEDTLKTLQLDVNVSDIIELLLALGLIVFKGYQVSQDKHIFIDPQRLRVRIHNRLVGQIQTQSIEAMICLQSPDPLLLLWDQHQVMTIAGWQTTTEALTMLVAIADRVASLQVQAAVAPSATIGDNQSLSR